MPEGFREKYRGRLERERDAALFSKRMRDLRENPRRLYQRISPDSEAGIAPNRQPRGGALQRLLEYLGARGYGSGVSGDFQRDYGDEVSEAPPETYATRYQYPGQEGLNPYIPVSPGTTGFHEDYMPQQGQQSTMMRNAPLRRLFNEEGY